MWTDPIVEEIHKIREAHATKFNYDLLAIVRDYQRQQRQSRKKIVSFVKKEDYIPDESEMLEA